jgi:delta-aminolevulinic acid dehydratase/porphobilinogen synthase
VRAGDIGWILRLAGSRLGFARSAEAYERAGADVVVTYWAKEAARWL